MIEFKEPKDSEPIRIAIREEGEWINAYMICDALKINKGIARIPTTAVNADPELFTEFKAMLTNHLQRFMEISVGFGADSTEVKERPA